jgi:heme-degrading monooxygenase HmoA
MHRSTLFLSALACANGLLVGSPSSGLSGAPLRAPVVTMATEQASALTSATGIAAERYVATNRFRVKEGREAAFEKRWADRQSRLGLLDGFRFFCMMRRVDGKEPAEDDVNYISCTVWDDISSFDAWKKGDAFKEAHGGGTIGGIASMLVATARNTKGKPKPAMWEGLLPVSGTTAPEATPGGWRTVVADGSTTLEAEAFIAMNRFSVTEGGEAAFEARASQPEPIPMALVLTHSPSPTAYFGPNAFEARFAARESTLASFDGFKAFTLLRRDGSDPDGFTHSTWSVWRDRAAFEVWQGSEQRAGKPGPPVPSAPAGGKPAGGPPGGGKPPFVRKPVPTFYEGIFVLESAKGA